MRGPGWLPLLVAAAAVLLRVSFAASSHSLRYFVTEVSEPGQGLPQFTAVGYVDDQLFVQYDRDTKKALPRVPWMKKVDAYDPQYWERETQSFRNAEHVFREGLVTLRGYYNQSGVTSAGSHHKPIWWCLENGALSPFFSACGLLSVCDTRAFLVEEGPSPCH